MYARATWIDDKIKLTRLYCGQQKRHLEMDTQNISFRMRIYTTILGFLLLGNGLVCAAEVIEPVLNVTEEYIDVPLNSILNLKCTGNSGLQWQFINPMTQEISNFESANETSSGTAGNVIFESIINLDLKSYENTGRYFCISSTAPNKFASLYVFVNDLKNLLLPMDGLFMEILHVYEAQPTVVPCLPTKSDASVTLWKGTCTDEHVPSDFVSYDPTKGFLISHPTKYFQGRFCCQVQFSEHKKEFMYIFDFTAHTQVIPQVHMDASNAEYVIVNSSFSLTCIIMVEEGTMFETNWSCPVYDEERVHIGLITRNSSLEQGIFQAHTQKLTIKEVRKADEGFYRCNVTDHSFKHNFFEVFVPVYEKEIPSVVIFQNTTYNTFPLIRDKGETVTFEVPYRVFPPSNEVDITWMKDWISITNKSGKYEISHANGISRLAVHKVSRNDSGTYTLLGDAPGGTSTFPIDFKVKDKPDVRIITSERCCYIKGSNYELRCLADGFPRPNTKWIWKPSCGEKKCDPVDVFGLEHKLGNHTNVLNITGPTLDANDTVILSLFVTPETSGEYFCSSSNEMGTTEENIPFIVTDVKDGFAIMSETVSPVESEAFSLNCSASKFLYENAQLNWLPSANRTTVPLQSIDVNRSESQYSWIVKSTFDMVTLNDSGTYECLASYKDQSLGLNKATVFIKVRALEKPYINETNINSSEVIAVPDDEFKLFCYVNGVPTPRVTWYRNGEPLNADRSGVKFSDDFQTLTISRLVTEDSGNYECKAKNKVGEDSRNTTLTVLAVLEVSMTSRLDSKQIAILSVVGIGVLSTLILFFLLGRRLYKHKKKQEQLQLFNHKVFQEGQMSLFNPDLPLDDQTEVLPYDIRWEFPRERLKLGRTIGQGAFGRVVKAEAVGLNDYEDSTTVAVKMLKERADVNQQKALMAELKILIHLGHHVNIVNLLGAITKNIPKGELMVMVEYCRYGNLRHYLLRYRDKYIAQENLCSENVECAKQHLRSSSKSHSGDSDTGRGHFFSVSLSTPSPVSLSIPSTVSPGSSVENRTYEFFKNSVTTNPNTAGSSASDSSRVLYFRADSKEHCITTGDLICYGFQCARGMAYLASRKLIHRDLAARNVLLANENIVKICDFGLAKDCYKYSNYVKKGDGPLPVKWMAIESIGDKVFTTKSDVWSFGVLLWEFFSLGGNPYPGVQVDEDFYRRLKQGYRMGKPDHSPDVIYQIMRDCWKSDPENRPDFVQLENALGELLETGIKQHFIDLNEPYTEMNEQILNHSYLNVGQNKEPTAEYVNSEISSSTFIGYDRVPPVRYSTSGEVPKSPMEVVPMIHFGCDEEVRSPLFESERTNNLPSCSTDYLSMDNRNLSETDDDSVFVDFQKDPSG